MGLQNNGILIPTISYDADRRALVKQYYQHPNNDEYLVPVPIQKLSPKARAKLLVEIRRIPCMEINEATLVAYNAWEERCQTIRPIGGLKYEL